MKNEKMNNNRSFVSPILRRVFSRSDMYAQAAVMSIKQTDQRRSESRMSTDRPPSKDVDMDILTDENVQFMDQPLRGKIELRSLPAPIESVTIALRGVVKVCVAGNAAWASGFGSDSNVMARFTEKEVS
jgi:hypothetical protein